MRQTGRSSRAALALLVSLTLLASTQTVGARPGGSRTAAAHIRVRNGVTQPVFSYKDAIRETIYIESSIDDDGDGLKDLIATDIIRPKETKTDSSFDVPVIYEMSPYYQAIYGMEGNPLRLGRGNEHESKGEEDGDYKPEFFPLFYDNYFVPRGYAFIAQDMPGTRNSQGCMVLGGNGELAAAKATLAWLTGKGKAWRLNQAGLPDQEVKATWSSGKVGMIGKSYDGTIANAAASMGLPGLKTIVPVGGISRWYDYHLNRGVQYVNAYSTPGLFVYYIDQAPGDDEEAVAKWVQATFTDNTTCQAKGSEIATLAANPSGDYKPPPPNEWFWHERDYLRDPRRGLPDSILYPSTAKKASASVFIANGINDFNVKPNHFVQWWNALANNNVPRKLWLSQTGHVDPFDYRREKFVRTLHRWFDRWLHGIDNGIMSEPRVDIERRPDVWKTYRDWPAPNARRLRLWFGPSTKELAGTLLRRRAPKDKTMSYTDSEDGTSEGNMVADPSEQQDFRLLFLTNKLNRSVRVSGQIPVKVSAQVDRPDTNFTMLLVDYGRALRVNHEAADDGITTSSTKESCHGASTQADDACYFVTQKLVHTNDIEIVTRGWLDAKHNKAMRESNPLTPGERYRFRWSGFGEDYVFKKGHRIGVVIAGSDSDWTIPDGQQATVTVDLHRSRVVLPVVGKGRRARF